MKKHKGIRIKSGKFHQDILKSCGKLPAKPNLAALIPVLNSGDFSGDADQYVDDVGSSLHVLHGPCNRANDADDNSPTLLMQYGADPTYRNSKGESDMAYAKAWAGTPLRWSIVADQIIKELVALGFDPNEAAAFSEGRTECHTKAKYRFLVAPTPKRMSQRGCWGDLARVGIRHGP
jgi:hypothetical protein